MFCAVSSTQTSRPSLPAVPEGPTDDEIRPAARDRRGERQRQLEVVDVAGEFRHGQPRQLAVTSRIGPSTTWPTLSRTRTRYVVLAARRRPGRRRRRSRPVAAHGPSGRQSGPSPRRRTRDTRSASARPGEANLTGRRAAGGCQTGGSGGWRLGSCDDEPGRTPASAGHWHPRRRAGSRPGGRRARTCRGTGRDGRVSRRRRPAPSRW